MKNDKKQIPTKKTLTFSQEGPLNILEKLALLMEEHMNIMQQYGGTGALNESIGHFHLAYAKIKKNLSTINMRNNLAVTIGSGHDKIGTNHTVNVEELTLSFSNLITAYKDIRAAYSNYNSTPEKKSILPPIDPDTIKYLDQYLISDGVLTNIEQHFKSLLEKMQALTLQFNHLKDSDSKALRELNKTIEDMQSTAYIVMASMTLVSGIMISITLALVNPLTLIITAPSLLASGKYLFDSSSLQQKRD